MNPSVNQLFSNSIGAKAWFAALTKATRLAGIAPTSAPTRFSVAPRSLA
jgi:hypothetical protein